MIVQARITFKLPQQGKLEALTCGPSGHVSIEGEAEAERHQ